MELGSSYSVLAASEPSAVERLNLAQEHRLAEYASEGPPALAGLQFHFLSSCLHVSSWAEDAEPVSTLETHVGTSLRRRRAGSHDPGEGAPLWPHGAPHSCPLPTVFLTTPHLIRRCHDRRTYKRGLGGDGCDREVLVGGGKRACSGAGICRVGDVRGGGVWPAWIVTQGQEEPSSAHRSPGDVFIPENNCGQWAELCEQCRE